MNTLSAVRRRVDAIGRIMAPYLAILRVRRLADEYSRQWTVAVADQQPPPDTHSFILQVAAAGIPAHHLHVGP